LRGDALTVNACQNLRRARGWSLESADEILREWKPISRQTSFCHSSTCHCAYLSNKQGIGIIIIVDYFATRFALRAGPILESDLFDIRNSCKEEICFRNICRESDYAHSSTLDQVSKKWFRRDDPKLQV